MKRKLHTLSAQKWESIPEIGDYSLRNKKKRFERFVPVPRTLLEKARQEQENVTALDLKSKAAYGTHRVRTPMVERDLGSIDQERRLLDEGSKRFLSFFKLWLMLGQLEERLAHMKEAKEVYESGFRHCPTCIPLWLCLSILEETINGPSKACAILTIAWKENMAHGC